jgi:hypothetical protein
MDILVDDYNTVLINGVKNASAIVHNLVGGGIGVEIEGQLYPSGEIAPPAPPIEPELLLEKLGVTKAEFVHLVKYVQAEEWDAATDYNAGDEVSYVGRLWVALPDVSRGISPDDIYAIDLSSGGWAPLG